MIAAPVKLILIWTKHWVIVAIRKRVNAVHVHEREAKNVTRFSKKSKKKKISGKNVANTKMWQAKTPLENSWRVIWKQRKKRGVTQLGTNTKEDEFNFKPRFKQIENCKNLLRKLCFPSCFFCVYAITLFEFVAKLNHNEIRFRSSRKKGKGVKDTKKFEKIFAVGSHAWFVGSGRVPFGRPKVSPILTTWLD